MIGSGGQGGGTQGGHKFDAEGRLTEVLSAPQATGGAAGFACVDLDGDGTITSAESMAIYNAFRAGMNQATPGWNELMDLNQDGTVAYNPDATSENAHIGQSCVTTRDVYTYDGNGVLLKRAHLVQSAGGWTTQSSTTYIGGVYEKHQDGSVVEYYAAMGRTIAMRTVGASGGAGTLVWPLLDQLGSTVAETDAGGTVLSRQDYWPYGTTRSVQAYAPVTETDRLYTGQQQEQGDPALGLYNYKARFYSTALGRFVSADTSTKDGYDRFGYVRGNPETRTDPSGQASQDAGGGNGCDAACGLHALSNSGLSSKFWLAFAAFSAAGLPVRPSAVPKLAELVDRFGADPDQLVNQFLESGQRFADNGNLDPFGNPNVNIVLPRPDGNGYIRITLNNEQDVVVSAGYIRADDYERYLGNGRFSRLPTADDTAPPEGGDARGFLGGDVDSLPGGSEGGCQNIVGTEQCD